MELLQDKILSSFMDLLHHRCRCFNNKIVIGRRDGAAGEKRCDNNAGSRVEGVKRSSELEQLSSVLFERVRSEYLDNVNMFVLLQMYAATFSSIEKASSWKLLLYWETRKRKDHFSTSQALFPLNFFFHFCSKHTLMNYTIVGSPKTIVKIGRL